MNNPSCQREAKENNNKLTLSMVIKNEADRYLKRVLEEHKYYIDSAVIIDDGSTDNSVELCKELLKDIPLKLIQNPVSRFSNEIELRKQQWNETISTNPDWILNLDADEMFESVFRYAVKDLINQKDFDVICFRLYDFWDENHYREDTYWRAHLVYRPFLVRYQKSFNYVWHETPQHCGRFPKNLFELPAAGSVLRVKHYGWARHEDRISKYKRYIALDPEGKYGALEQFKAALDKNPTLIEWKEQENG